MPAKDAPRGGTRGIVFREIARMRLEDAKILLNETRFSGAIYLAGYAIECQLKYAFCARNNQFDLPARLETHDWEHLLAAAGRAGHIKTQRPIMVIYEALVERWGPALRYRTRQYAPTEALRLYNDMEALYDFLNEIVP